MSFSEPQRDETLKLLKSIINTTLEDVPVNVYLFGSWARMEEKRTSDIDVALQPQEEIPTGKWVELRERIEESTLPINVDLVDLSKADPNLVTKVKKERIQWKGCANEFKSQTGH